MNKHFFITHEWSVPCLYQILKLSYDEIEKISGIDYIILSFIKHNNGRAENWGFYIQKLQLSDGMQEVFREHMETLVNNNVLTFTNEIRNIPAEIYFNNFMIAPVRLLKLTQTGKELYEKKMMASGVKRDKIMYSQYNFITQQWIYEMNKGMAPSNNIEKDTRLYRFIVEIAPDRGIYKNELTSNQKNEISELAKKQLKLNNGEIIDSITVNGSRVAYDAKKIGVNINFYENEEGLVFDIIPVNKETKLNTIEAMFVRELIGQIHDEKIKDLEEILSTHYKLNMSLDNKQVILLRDIDSKLDNKEVYILSDEKLLGLFSNKLAKYLVDEKLIKTIPLIHEVAFFTLSSTGIKLYFASGNLYSFINDDSITYPINYLLLEELKDEAFEEIKMQIIDYCISNFLMQKTANTKKIYDILSPMYNAKDANNVFYKYLEQAFNVYVGEDFSINDKDKIQRFIEITDELVQKNNKWKDNFADFKNTINNKLIISIGKIVTLDNLQETLKEALILKKKLDMKNSDFLGAISHLSEMLKDFEPENEIKLLDQIVSILENDRFKDKEINKAFKVMDNFIELGIHQQNKLELNSELGIIASQFINTLSKLKLITEINDIHEYTIKSDMNTKEYTETYSGFKNQYNNIGDYLTNKFSARNIIKFYANIFDTINNVLSIEDNAYTKFNKIDKKYIEKNINKKDLRGAIVNLHVKLEIYLRKILNKTKANSVELINIAHDKKIITEEEYVLIDKVRKIRNTLLHSQVDLLDLDISSSELHQCSEIIFDKLEPLYDKKLTNKF